MIASVLIVDDDSDVRRMLSSVLEDDGYSVEAVDNGRDAIKTCGRLPFDVALVDINLPDVKGTALLHELKRIQPRMVNVIITGDPSVENAVKALYEKADGFITKPFDPQELLDTVRRLIVEKRDEYLRLLTEAENAKKKNPILGYGTPDRW
jgi:DNA-binding NtrC family response regulator